MVNIINLFNFILNPYRDRVVWQDNYVKKAIKTFARDYTRAVNRFRFRFSISAWSSSRVTTCT